MYFFKKIFLFWNFEKKPTIWIYDTFTPSFNSYSQLWFYVIKQHKIIEVKFEYYAITYLLSLITMFLFVCKKELIEYKFLKKPLVIRSNDKSVDKSMRKKPFTICAL